MHIERGYCESFVYILQSSNVCFINIIFGNKLVLECIGMRKYRLGQIKRQGLLGGGGTHFWLTEGDVTPQVWGYVSCRVRWCAVLLQSSLDFSGHV